MSETFTTSLEHAGFRQTFRHSPSEWLLLHLCLIWLRQTTQFRRANRSPRLNYNVHQYYYHGAQMTFILRQAGISKMRRLAPFPVDHYFTKQF